MFKTTIRRAAPIVVVLALLTSGCFQIRSMRITPDFLDTGDRAIVRVDMNPAGNGTGYINTGGYPFLLVGFDDSVLSNPTVSQFDMFSNFGGRFDRTADNTLRNLLRSGNECTANGIDAADVTGMKWWAWRTTGTVDSTAGALGDIFRVKVAFDRIAGDDGAAGDFVIFTGTWGEISIDGVPTSGEVACTSMVFSSIAFDSP